MLYLGLFKKVYTASELAWYVLFLSVYLVGMTLFLVGRAIERLDRRVRALEPQEEPSVWSLDATMFYAERLKRERESQTMRVPADNDA